MFLVHLLQILLYEWNMSIKAVQTLKKKFEHFSSHIHNYYDINKDPFLHFDKRWTKEVEGLYANLYEEKKNTNKIILLTLVPTIFLLMLL